MTEHDAVLVGYEDWLQEAMQKALSPGEYLMWLGGGRWALMAPEGPDVFLVTFSRAEVRAASGGATK